MIKNRWVLGILFIDFFALTGYAVYTEGIGALFSTITGSIWGFVLVVDLTIALFLVLTYIFKDAKSRGDSPPFGWAALTVATGSIGPLLYLLKKREA